MGEEKFVFWELKDKFACVFGFVVFDGGFATGVGDMYNYSYLQYNY